MALTKSSTIDKIEVMEHGQVQVRTKTVIKEDNVEISSAFARHSLEPQVKTEGSWGNTDISGEDARVQAICNATWTDSVKSCLLYTSPSPRDRG